MTVTSHAGTGVDVQVNFPDLISSFVRKGHEMSQAIFFSGGCFNVLAFLLTLRYASVDVCSHSPLCSEHAVYRCSVSLRFLAVSVLSL